MAFQFQSHCWKPTQTPNLPSQSCPTPKRWPRAASFPSCLDTKVVTTEHCNTIGLVCRQVGLPHTALSAMVSIAAPAERKALAVHAAQRRQQQVPDQPTLDQLQPIKGRGWDRDLAGGDVGIALAPGSGPGWANRYPMLQSPGAGHPLNHSSRGVAIPTWPAMGLDLTGSSSPHILDGPGGGWGPRRGRRPAL